MIEQLNSRIRPLLDVYEELKHTLKLAKISEPKIATCGMQSHGKSSTLESITKIELPTKAETCTICPIKICLREIKGEEYFTIKIEEEENDDNANEKESDKNTNLKKIKEKIDDCQDKIKQKYNLKDQSITQKCYIQLNVYKNDVPNLNLYDLPGVTFVDEIKEEAENIYEKYLNEKETTVLLILNGSDDLTNSSVTDWMKKKNIQNYKYRFIPVVAKADKITNFEGKYKQLNSLGLINKPCLIINKNNDSKEFKKLSEEDEVKKINEIIPNIDKFDVNIGRKQLIEELIKIQFEHYKENVKNMKETLYSEIKKKKEILDKLPPECDDKNEFCDHFFDLLEELLKDFNEDIKKFKKGPEGNLLKFELQNEYKVYIQRSKEKVNELLTLDFCNYVTNNVKQINSDNITIREDEIPFQLLIVPKLKEILNVFEEVIDSIFRKIKSKIEEYLKNAFTKYINLKSEIVRLYNNYSDIQYNKMTKFYKEICLLETKNITSFDLELNYKCNALVRKILNFLYKGNELENNINTNSNENTNNDSNQNQNIKKKEDTSDNVISDEKEDIIKGVKNINNFIVQKFKELTKDTIEKLNLEVKQNPNYKEEVKKKFDQYKSDITQIIGMINNYEVEQLTRIYDSLGCKGRPKLAYEPENITTFDERIEDFNLNEDEGYEFIPGFQYIKNKNLNDFINLFKSGQVIPKTANTVVKMVVYAEVMCNRTIDVIFLAIQNYLYDNLTNREMCEYLRNEVHKLLIKQEFEESKKLLEVNREIAEEIKLCKMKIRKFEAALEKVNKAEIAFNNPPKDIKKPKKNNKDSDGSDNDDEKDKNQKKRKNSEDDNSSEH